MPTLQILTFVRIERNISLYRESQYIQLSVLRTKKTPQVHVHPPIYSWAVLSCQRLWNHYSQYTVMTEQPLLKKKKIPKLDDEREKLPLIGRGD